MRASAWIDDEHCSMRCVHGTDPAVVANRIAFIEKSPRVRVSPWTEIDDWKNWQYGPKGNAPEYGKHVPSREWCDDRLREMGYELEDLERIADVDPATMQIGDRVWRAKNHWLCKLAATNDGFDANTARQGFITSIGRIVGRAEALHIAIRAGQVEEGKTINRRHLFSEDLYEKLGG